MVSYWLDLLCEDRKGKNFVEMVTSIDVGREEWWSAMIHWENEKAPRGDFTIYLVTQYNPPPICDHPCDHFPRNHLDDGMLDHQGNIILDGTDVI